MKRALKWLGIVVVVLLLAAFGVYWSAFGKNSAIVDGAPIAPGVTSVKDGFVSVYVLDAAPGKVALVDAGNDKSGKAILAALAARGLAKESVRAILLTHGHGDHVAACKLFPDAEVYAMQTELATIGDAAKVTHPLKDGEAFDVGEMHVEAFATPGHTPGSAVYFARGVLFFGDSAGASKDGTVMKAVRLFSGNSAENVASLNALAARMAPRAAEVKVLAFAHTGPLNGLGPLEAFAAARE
jgi:hydroxyacylglutathione hydrolase